MKTFADNSVDLVFTSPPYEAARMYGELQFKLKGQAWVDWCVERFLECVRVSRGLVAWVIEGQTRKFRYTATPALLMADLHRAGVNLRKPPIFYRVGIPGSGGPDWLRNDWEFIVCASKGRLPWSDNTVMGHPPKWAPGGEMSNRHVDGRRKNSRDKLDRQLARRNQWGASRGSTERKANGLRGSGFRHSHRLGTGQNLKGPCYSVPVRANQGNVIKCKVGGGVMGDRLCHENEAPFPESLAEFFIRSFCPPSGIVLDPFCGSGTTLAVAEKFGRKWIGIDLRES